MKVRNQRLSLSERQLRLFERLKWDCFKDGKHLLLKITEASN